MDTSVFPPADRFCDLVMKGGITSGVVYPKAIELLSKEYRFRSIGGTSAGAIAAAVTAAAEYQRRQKNSSAGFELLRDLPEKLGEPLSPRKRKLLSLFQPQPGTRRLFRVLIGALNSKGTYRRVLAISAGFLVAYWPATLASIVAAYALLTLDGWLAALLGLLLLLPVSVGAWVYIDITRKVVENNFGLCTGMTASSPHPALTPWLHDLIQRAAGRNASDAPLTFGDLWHAEGFPPPWLTLPAAAPPRSIDLQMFSTNLTHGRPYIFPLPEPDLEPSRYRTRDRLFFKPEELMHYLPTEVLEWLRKKASGYQRDLHSTHNDPPTSAGDGLLELPPPADFPVLLAARMSLSFPFLFSAVPLWAIDYDSPPPKDDRPEQQRRFHCCWFSDGGISSNFPMHLFDGLVPLWPTFGIDLEPAIVGRGPVFLPKDYAEGYGERWTRFGEKRSPASRLGGFISAIVSAMQNWNDNALARMPGVRDRVARVRLTPDEGGMNLNMERELITRIAEHGEDAAKRIVARFGEKPGGIQAKGWDEHRLVRLSVLLKAIIARAPGVANALNPSCGHATDFPTLIYGATRHVGPGYERILTPNEDAALRGDLLALQALAGALTGEFPFKSFPPTELRPRPPL